MAELQSLDYLGRIVVETLLALCVCYLVLVEVASRAGQWVEGRVSRFLTR